MPVCVWTGVCMVALLAGAEVVTALHLRVEIIIPFYFFPFCLTFSYFSQS